MWCWKFLSSHISFRGRKYRKLLDMQGYDPNLLSRYIGLSKKSHQALSILVIPIHEKIVFGPWTNYNKTTPLSLNSCNISQTNWVVRNKEQTVMADTTGITKQHKLEFVIMYIYYLPPVPHILA